MRPQLALACASLTGLVALVTPRPAEAGCGFYAPPATASGAALVNDADQVVLMREGTRVALTMSTNYKGPSEDFAMIVPVPVVLKQEAVKTLSPAIFEHLEKLTAPRIVVYEEKDPCAKDVEGMAQTGGAPGGAVGGGGGGDGKGGGNYGVTVEAQFISGEYDIVVLGATESDGLERWLVDNKYKVPTGASTALAPYIAEQQKFVVAKVDQKRAHRDDKGEVVLSPLRFVYETTDFRLPVRLGLLNAPPGGKQDVLVYLFARERRVEAANYPNVFAPTNVDVDASVMPKLGSFSAALFDASVKKSGGKGIVTEYAWNASGCGAPCTTTPLTMAEVEKLGADDLFLGKVGIHELALTRVHARYDATTLNEDIVFRTADPVAGGREGDPGADKVDKVDGTLGFQTKYAVRKAWTGPVECAEPKRGQWIAKGGSGQSPALGLAGAPRDVPLDEMIASPIAALGLGPQHPPFGAVPTRDKGKDSGDGRATPPWMWIAIAGGSTLALGLVIWMMARRKPG